MGLISEYVEVGLCSANIKYYENLGYEIPRRIDNEYRLTVPRGTKIKVKVSDLPYGSNVYVDVRCDCCQNIRSITYNNYNRNKHGDKSYCTHCFQKIFISGEKSPNWNPNKTKEERFNQRCYPEYTEFIKKVMERDNYTCQCCGEKSSRNLSVHHLDGYNWCKEKRTDETNGITLCNNCHYNFHLKYGRGNNTKKQFEEWIGHAIIELKKYNGKLSKAREIYCVEDGILYDSAMCASKAYGIAVQIIRKVCNHKYTQTHGKHFLYKEEYLNKTQEELNIIKNTYGEQYKTRKVICTTTGIVFNSIRKAKAFYNATNITTCCQNMNRYSGKLSDGTPLKWMYYEDFLKLPIEEQNEILSRNKNSESSNDGSFLLDKEAM